MALKVYKRDQQNHVGRNFVHKKQTQEGKVMIALQSINNVAEFAKASERFLNNNENLVHLILLAVFLLLTKKLFLGRF